ncbi:MAG: hypothetical protein F4066_07580 [Chloroflexi bacterium]|nr:hypothetical protein [Chloroflexota bacterium]MXY85970.1 hypothetical protein [Chloroflexota bacterium]MYB23016.1 hypothetical protein [Chloroflexota bacterium]MYD73626.1 hypothetical protein [Chloroflexota bacterium]MYI04708.1 hypothetical protein [Chloroflexota bacterium]
MPTGCLDAEPALLHHYRNGTALTESLLSWTDKVAALQQSTVARRCTRATAEVSVGASWSRKSSAGSRPSAPAASRATRYPGRARNKLWLELTTAAYNLTRLANLEAAAT